MVIVNRRRAILSGLGLAILAPRPAHAQLSTRLSRQTDKEFDAYVRGAESQIEWQPKLQPAPDGKVVCTAANGSSPVEVKDGLIHDWVAAAIAPRANVAKVLAVLQNYEDYKRNYAPNIRDSRVLEMSRDYWRVFLTLYRDQGLTTILNTEYDIRYSALGEGRWNMVSRSTKVAEVDGDKELPVGTGHGYLWRLNAYWLLEQRPKGVYMECRAISLSRNVPIGLGWLLKPLITTVPRESLLETIGSTIKALG